MGKKCRNCNCPKDFVVDDLCVNGDIDAKGSTLYISTITTGTSSPVQISSLSTCGITSCSSSSPIIVTGDVSINGDLTVSGITNIINYNLTNMSVGNGVSILDSLTGPGGSIRNFKTLTSNDDSISITSNANTIDFSSAITLSNVGTGVGIYSNRTNNTFNLQSIQSISPSITVTEDPNNNTIDLNYVLNRYTVGINYNSMVVVPPYTWIPLTIDNQFEGPPTYTFTTNGITGGTIPPLCKAQLNLDLNVNPTTSLAAVGATLFYIRYFNQNLFYGYQQIVVPPQQNNPPNNVAQGTPGGLLTFTYVFNLTTPVNNLQIQVWQNGTSNYTIIGNQPLITLSPLP